MEEHDAMDGEMCDEISATMADVTSEMMQSKDELLIRQKRSTKDWHVHPWQ